MYHISHFVEFIVLLLFIILLLVPRGPSSQAKIEAMIFVYNVNFPECET